MPLRILLVGEPEPDAFGLETLLREEAFDIVGRAPDARAALDLARSLQPDIAVLEVVTFEDAALAALAAVCVACPPMRVIAVGVETSPPHIEAAFRAGLSGYVLKTSGANDLVRAIREVARAGVFLSPRASRAVVEKYL